MRLTGLAIYLTLALNGLAVAQDGPALSDISKRLQESRGLNIELPADNPEARAAAEVIVGRFQSPEQQSLLQQEMTRLQDTVFGSITKEYRPGGPSPSGSAPGRLAEDERVYLFFSSSVPTETMRNYMAMIERADDPNLVMVLRGFVGGMKTVKPTLDYLTGLILKDPGCDPAKGAEKCETYQVNIQIDPLLFVRYGIEEAPSVVFAAGVPRIERSEAEAAGPAWVIKGDAALDYLLARINREAKSQSLAGLIRAMQGNQ